MGVNAWIKSALKVLLWLVVIWLVSPAATAVNIEAYTARMQSMAFLMATSSPSQYDPIMPLHAEYLYLTRHGVISLLSLYYKIFGAAPDVAFRVITAVSFSLLVLFSGVFAREWAGIPFRISVPLLLLMPGLSQISFYFNDNVVAAALVSAALANVSPGANPWRYFLSGVLLACAIDCRTDSVLALALLTALAVADAERTDRVIINRWLGLATGFVMALGGFAWAGGFSWLEVVAIIGVFAKLPTYRLELALSVAMLYFGIVGWALIAAGFWHLTTRLTRRRRYLRLFGLVLTPIAIYGVILFTIGSNMRYGYPLLSCFFAMYGGIGVLSLLAQWRRGRKRLIVGASAFCVSLTLAPSPAAFIQDGPQLLFGQFWSPVYWRQWQEPIRTSSERAEAWIKTRDRTPLTIVITTHFNDEAYIREHLFFDRFKQQVAEEVYPSCRGFFVFTKGETRIIFVRTYDLYGLGAAFFWPQNRGEAFVERSFALMMLPLEEALSCIDLSPPAEIYISAYSKFNVSAPRNVYPASAISSLSDLEILQFAPLRSMDLLPIRNAARDLTVNLRAQGGQLVTLDRLLHVYRARGPRF